MPYDKWILEVVDGTLHLMKTAVENYRDNCHPVSHNNGGLCRGYISNNHNSLGGYMKTPQKPRSETGSIRTNHSLTPQLPSSRPTR
ncbi:hypothetical protein E2C01_046415 [Portunus trituberculatus]|uniref:Uncharacterized protein n=1 Tax=Portunus trituberculatus TaxID=210409 RepID=A0A5B7G7P5_PORTR|nr:hypothetical protein [Portunus trituberculatus]